MHRISSTFRHTEASELATQLRDLLLGVVILHDLKWRLGKIELIKMMLCEHRTTQLVVTNHLTLHRHQIAQQQLRIKPGNRGNLD